MNVGEYGIYHNILVGYDLSGNTSLSLTYTRPDASTFTATSPAVTVGSVPYSTGYVNFPANQYSIYRFKQGDLTVPGAYSARLTYNDASDKLISSVVTFTVNP